MKRHTLFALGLALTLACIGAWTIDSQGAGSAAGEGTQLQAPAPAHANPSAQQEQTAPNAAQPNPAAPDQTRANPAQPNQGQPDQAQPDAAQPHPAPPNPVKLNPAAPPPNQFQANPAPPNQGQPVPPASSVPGETGSTAAPVYYSPLQEFASHQVDEVGELGRQIDRFRAARRPEAVMALYHMIRDHRLLADAAQNVLARRGDVTTPTITVMPTPPTTPEEMIRQDIQGRQAAAANLQQLISSAISPEDRNIYQHALNATNQHLHWLQALDQGQPVQVGFFGPTTPLGQLAGPAPVATASATGYPQPTISQRVAGYQQRMPPRRAMSQRRFRHERSAPYRRRHRSRSRDHGV